MPLGARPLDNMQLTTTSGHVIDNPGAEQIERELRTLSGGADSFLILSRDELTYLQVAGGGEDPFTLEYQDGSLERHYRTVRDVSLDSAIRVFMAYRERGDRWHALVEWELVDLRPSSRMRHSLVLGLVGLIVLAMALVYLWLVAP
jgi:hypothetical protein